MRILLYQRFDGKPILENDQFDVIEGRRGQGTGAGVLGRQVEQARRLGVVEIPGYAARDDRLGDIGYLVWPLLGFDAILPRDLLDRLPRHLSGAHKLSDLVRTVEGREWSRENGDSTAVFLDMAPRSEPSAGSGPTSAGRDRHEAQRDVSRFHRSRHRADGRDPPRGGGTGPESRPEVPARARGRHAARGRAGPRSEDRLEEAKGRQPRAWLSTRRLMIAAGPPGTGGRADRSASPVRPDDRDGPGPYPYGGDRPRAGRDPARLPLRPVRARRQAGHPHPGRRRQGS